MKIICLAACLIFSTCGFSQADTSLSRLSLIDTTAMLDSMASDLALLKELMGEHLSYFNMNVNIGNQTFSKNNFSLNTQQATENTLSLKPGAGYYHQSGFSVSGLAYLNLSHIKGGFYQYSITPAYDYSGKGKIAAGIAYTHYFTKAKDTIAAYATPYDNEIYAYAFLSEGVIQPGITFGYATGKFTNVYRGKFQGPLGGAVFVVDSQKTRQSDFSVSASVQHNFNWYDVISNDDGLSFTPTLMLNAGSSNTKVLAHSNKQVSNLIAKRPNNRFRVQNVGFEVYSIGLSLNLTYEIGKMYFQSEGYFDYYLPASDKRFTSLFSLTAGINL